MLNALQLSPEWDSTAVFLAYDDSDGWYDHVFLPPQQGSDGPSDALNGVGPLRPAARPRRLSRPLRAGPAPAAAGRLAVREARTSSTHTQTEQASITRFIEDNWSLGRIGDQSFDARAASLSQMFDFAPGDARAPKLCLDPTTGQPLGGTPARVAIAPTRPDPGPRPGPTPTATRRRDPDADRRRRSRRDQAEARGQAQLQGQRRRQADHALLHRRRQGRDASRPRVRFRIVSKKKVVASGSGELAKKKIKVVVKPKKTLKKGRYTLRITITQTGRTPAADEDDPPEVVRRALLAAVLCLAGCGGGQPTPAASIRSRRRRRRASQVTKIAGTDLSRAGGRRRRRRRAAQRRRRGRTRAAAGRGVRRARSRAIARYSARQAAAMAARRDGAGARAAARSTGRPRGARWAAVYERYLQIGAAYGALGDARRGDHRDRLRLERGLWGGEPLPALRPAAARLARDVRHAAPDRPARSRSRRSTTRSARTRSSRTPSATCSAAPPRRTAAPVCAPTAASLEATDAVVDTLRPLLGEPRRARADRDRPARPAPRARARSGAPTAAVADARRAQPHERQRLNGRLGAGPGDPRAASRTRSRPTLPPAIPELRP